VFIRDEVAKPMIGEKKYERFMPFIMTLFFFILFCNLLGLLPFFPGGSNVTGNIGVTLVLAVFAFIVTNLNGNKHYWEHIFWMPGIPAWVKTILTPVEVLGLVIKPFSLMIRLFANISAGHIIILSLIGLVFVFGNNGTNLGGGIAGAVIGGAFTAFMNLIELLVAFLQAFVFSLLTASYIGAAVDEGHGHDHDHDHGHDYKHAH
jgi:F-type H+-transporting ATPase subunit a